jgi:hypothetical protein
MRKRPAHGIQESSLKKGHFDQWEGEVTSSKEEKEARSKKEV